MANYRLNWPKSLFSENYVSRIVSHFRPKFYPDSRFPSQILSRFPTMHLEVAAGSAAPARDGRAQTPATHGGVEELPEAAGLLAEEPNPLRHPLHVIRDVFIVE